TVQQGIQRHRSAIAPATDACARLVEHRILTQQLIKRGQLVFQFDSPVLVPERCLELLTTVRSTTVVHRKDRHSMLCQEFVEWVGNSSAPLVQNKLSR